MVQFNQNMIIQSCLIASMHFYLLSKHMGLLSLIWPSCIHGRTWVKWDDLEDNLGNLEDNLRNLQSLDPTEISIM